MKNKTTKNSTAANAMFDTQKPKKVERLKIFDANSTSGYGYYDVNQDGVLHGAQAPVTATMVTGVESDIDTFIDMLRREHAQLGRVKVSRYEIVILRALQNLFKNKPGIKLETNVNIGYSNKTKTKAMTGDLVIRAKNYAMLIEVFGGMSSEGQPGPFHWKGKYTDTYKQKNYKKLGFNSFHAVKVIDNGPGKRMCVKTIRLHCADGSKSQSINMLDKDFLINEVCTIESKLEKDGVIKYIPGAATKACCKAWEETFSYFEKRAKIKRNIVEPD